MYEGFEIEQDYAEPCVQCGSTDYSGSQKVRRKGVTLTICSECLE